MAIIKSGKTINGTIVSPNTTISGIERNNFDYLEAYAKTQSSNPTIIQELVQSYVLISQNMGIQPQTFIAMIESQGNSVQQSIFLAAQLNSVRPRNALIGVIPNNTTPTFIAREIAA